MELLAGARSDRDRDRLKQRLLSLLLLRVRGLPDFENAADLSRGPFPPGVSRRTAGRCQG
jgi:hypothetical protein